MSDPTRLVIHDGDHDLGGAVRDGESWAAAARRTCASGHVEPVAHDLSGEVKEFVVERDHVVTLRAMVPGDLDDAVAWRASPEVRRWWEAGGLSTPDEIRTAYAERVDGLTPTRMWVVEVDGRSVGFVQDYRIGDYPDDAVLAPDPGAVGVDYAIGVDEWRGRGLGTAILWAWMLRARHRFADATSFFAAPDHRNAASLRVLAKAGFTPGARFDQQRSDGSVRTVVGHTLDVATVLG